MRIKLILTAFCILIVHTPVFAQTARWQIQRISLGTGTMVYRGDLPDDIVLKNIKPQFSLSYSKYMMPGIGYTLNVSRGSVAAADSLSSDADNQLRDLSFRSNITEASIMGFWEIIPDFRHNYWRRTTHFTPYVFAGIGAFTYNPYMSYGGSKIYLQPLGTEGQLSDSTARPYKMLSLCVPFGAGLSFRFMQRIGAFGEVGFRRTMTDYLDDISKRGDPSTRDWYILMNIGVSYFIGR